MWEPGEPWVDPPAEGLVLVVAGLHQSLDAEVHSSGCMIEMQEC